MVRDSTYRTRLAVAGDAKAIARVHYDAIRGTAAAAYPARVIESWAKPPDDETSTNIRRALEGDEESFVVAEVSGTIVGFASVVTGDEELRAVYVDPRHGRGGVGKMLLIHLEQVAADAGCTSLTMDASLNAEAFYRREGYRVIEYGEHALSSGVRMECVKMTKTLPRSGSTPA